ncbi:hypothetical protein RUND412_008972 [Rhizina undulata]
MKPKRSFLLVLLTFLTTTVLAQSTASSAATTNRASTAATTRSSSVLDLPNASSTTTTTSSTTAAAATTAASSAASLPSITSSTLSSDSSATTTADYTIPSVGIPPTANDPFMQRSNLPEGTVFIAVGSALGLFAILLVTWRAILAWSLHRSVKRAAAKANMADSKAILRPPPGSTGGFYAGGPGSTLSLDHLGSNGRSNGPLSPANSSLFFSPTAGNPPQGGNENRRSAYLPAGYYAAGTRDSVMHGPNSSQTHFASQSVSSSRYTGGRGLGVSPPESPSMAPSGSRGSAVPRSGSESHTSLTLPPTGRAPSDYLEDLLGQHSPRGGPGAGRGYSG